ncbi:MAG: septum site-determining protein MinD [Chloroflexi bacterium]|nr:septum site-determining protein MinD [Chloroflexota bacterium]
MAARIVTITSGKGGVGKTTTTANLGVALALSGKRVVTVDTDIGLRNLDVMLGLENRIVYDVVDVVEGRCRLHQALIRDKRLPQLHLLPAAQTRDKTAVNADDLTAVCEQLRPDFDFVIIDSPAGIEQGFQTAVAPADLVLIITTPEVAAVRDADRVIGLAEANDKGPAQLIINRLKPGLVRRGDMLSTADVVEILAIDLIGIVPEDEQIIVAANRGKPVAFESNTQAGMAFRNIARRLNGEEVPFLDVDKPQGILGRIFGRVMSPNA